VRAVMADERADVQLDLLLGFWKANFNNATSPAVKSLNMAPVAVARGEWLLPFFRDMGLQIILEQSVASFGGADKQSVLLSDWSMNAFYQRILPIKDGLQLRASVGYRQHLGDDNRDVPTLVDNNRNAKYVVVGGTANLYFARRWLLGGDFTYGLPSAMAGRGVKQSFMEGLGRIGFRMTSSLLLLMEGGYRTYRVESDQDDTMLEFQGGIRLEL
jgi:hypothetical protein